MSRLRAPVSGALPNLLLTGSAPPAPLLKRADLARWLNVSPRHTYKLEKRGLPRVDLEGPVRFDPQAAAAFIAAHTRRRDETSAMATGREDAPDQNAVISPRRGRGVPARIGLARELPSQTVRSLAPGLQAQAAARVRRGVRP